MLDLNHSQMMNQSQQIMNNQNSQMTMIMNPNTRMVMNQYKNRRGSYTKPSSNLRNNKKQRTHSNGKQLQVCSGGYNQLTVNELQQQNQLKARRYISKKKFNNGCKSAPFAPRNTTSFLIRAKKAGGITSLMSPLPVTPAVLTTPVFSPSSEVLGDTSKEEWGVDGYGSMKGLIRLRYHGNADDKCDCDCDGGSSESDVEDQELIREHVEVERRLDHDLSRFEMVYPNYNYSNCDDHSISNMLENRVDDQDMHITRLEDESLRLKERLFFMEREFDKLRTRLQCLETRGSRGSVEVVVVVKDSENEIDGCYGIGRSIVENSEVLEENDGKGLQV